MQQVLNDFLRIVQQIFSGIFGLIEMIWNWSFGQLINVLNSPWQNWSLVKQILLAAAIIAIVYIIYIAAMQIWGALKSLFNAAVGFITSLIVVLPHIVAIGLIAAAAGWLIPRLPI